MGTENCMTIPEESRLNKSQVRALASVVTFDFTASELCTRNARSPKRRQFYSSSLLVVSFQIHRVKILTLTTDPGITFLCQPIATFSSFSVKANFYIYLLILNLLENYTLQNRKWMIFPVYLFIFPRVDTLLPG